MSSTYRASSMLGSAGLWYSGSRQAVMTWVGRTGYCPVCIMWFEIRGVQVCMIRVMGGGKKLMGMIEFHAWQKESHLIK